MKTGLMFILIPFVLGLIMNQAWIDDVGLEMPFSTSPEVISPADRIKDSQVAVYDDKVVLLVNDVYLAGYADTNSMDPLIDETSTGLEIVPDNEDGLHIGDVVVYETDIGLIVHRIVEIGNDKDGKYFILKGDNNSSKDPYKVRFSQIRYVLVGVLY